MDAGRMTPEAERALFEDFNRQSQGALALIAQHRPLREILATVCGLVETTLDVRCIVGKRLDDGSFDFVCLGEMPEQLRRTSEHLLLSDLAHIDGPLGDPTPIETHDSSDPGGHRIWCLPLAGLGGQSLGALCISHDWPEVGEIRLGGLRHAGYLAQIALEQSLAASNFAGSMAAERQQMANQLHDDPIQAVTVLSLLLQRLGHKVPPDLQDAVAEARQKADHAIERMRRMLFELHPAALDEDGLAVAVEVYLEETFEALGIVWTLDDQLGCNPDHATARLVFRLIYEALSNVAAHSQASSVSVTLGIDRGGISARVSDDGVGFDPRKILSHRPGHLGLANVQYLARRNAGRFEITSAPGSGCMVDIWIPSHG